MSEANDRPGTDLKEGLLQVLLPTVDPYRRRLRLLYLAIPLLAISGVSVQAQSNPLEGVWAVGNQGNCSRLAYQLRIVGDNWEFTDTNGRKNVERLVQFDQEKYLTETVSSSDVPRGSRWLYNFRDNSFAQVKNVTSG